MHLCGLLFSPLRSRSLLRCGQPRGQKRKPSFSSHRNTGTPPDPIEYPRLWFEHSSLHTVKLSSIDGRGWWRAMSGRLSGCGIVHVPQSVHEAKAESRMFSAAHLGITRRGPLPSERLVGAMSSRLHTRLGVGMLVVVGLLVALLTGTGEAQSPSWVLGVGQLEHQCSLVAVRPTLVVTASHCVGVVGATYSGSFIRGVGREHRRAVLVWDGADIEAKRREGLVGAGYSTVAESSSPLRTRPCASSPR